MKRPVIEILVRSGPAQIVQRVIVNGEEWPVTLIETSQKPGSPDVVTLTVIPESVTINPETEAAA